MSTDTKQVNSLKLLRFKSNEIDKIKKYINYTAAAIAGVFLFLVTIGSIANGDFGTFLFGVFASCLTFGVVWIYLLPTYFAYVRCIGSRLPLFLINLLTGWALIPWVITLIWGISGASCWSQLYKQREEELPFNS